MWIIRCFVISKKSWIEAHLELRWILADLTIHLRWSPFVKSYWRNNTTEWLPSLHILAWSLWLQSGGTSSPTHDNHDNYSWIVRDLSLTLVSLYWTWNNSGLWSLVHCLLLIMCQVVASGSKFISVIPFIHRVKILSYLHGYQVLVWL